MSNMITTILTLFIVAVLGYVAFVTVHGYWAAGGTMWERLVAAFRASLTVFWARLNALSILAVAAVSEIASFLGAPGVKETIEPYLAPQVMLAYVVLVLLGAEVARRRTLEKPQAPEAQALQTAPEAQALQTAPEAQALQTAPEAQALKTAPEARALQTAPASPEAE